MMADGPATASAVNALIAELRDYHLVIDRSQRQLMLTPTGLDVARQITREPAGEERTRLLRIAVLRHVGRLVGQGHADPTHGVPLATFHAEPDSVISGVAATVYESFAAVRWLATAGLLGPLDSRSRTSPISLKINLARDGQQCLERYNGDPQAMEQAQQTQPGNTVHINQSTGFVIGNHNQFHQHIDQAVNLDKARWAVEAVLELLPQSGLAGAADGEIRRYAAEVIQELDQPEPDHSRIRAFRPAMLRIAEASAAGAIGTLLTLPW